ncbi:NAD-dependent epimerase/dehydratase family protein [Clostridium intestinale]|uniref:NAD(P)-dependent oxidoreductase n=1 Tax=Clostridium intestinale TaxID=36845 RepID=A0A7D6VZA3_9CLOT|nr:NAD(P)-dependent oxidoreductase [Clostridium intestinale]QLY79125.1 NAD(P)-dependent oxidoreductase [Clostridium intestinale]
MSKIVVTGATGYIGSNIVKKLLDDGNEIYLICRKSSSIENLKSVESKLNIFFYEDNIEALIEFFNKIKPDCVFHLASLFIAEHKNKDIGALIDSNIKFGTNILEAMKEANIKNLINTGTSWQNYNSEEYNPVCLYAATKEAYEKIIEYYVSTHELKVITLRLFDTFGPKDNRNKILNLLDKFSKEKTVLKMSPGEQMLDLTYIDDIVSGFCRANQLVGNMQVGKHYKYVLSSERIKLKDLIKLYESLSDKKVLVEWGARPYRDREVMIPCTNLEILPGWKAEISLKDGLNRMIEINKLMI